MNLKKLPQEARHPDKRTLLLAGSLVALMMLAPITVAQEAQTAPANDAFADAIVIAAVPYSTSQSTHDATDEASEPLACGFAANSVWYSYTAQGNDGVAINTFGSDYDTVLAVYTGSSLETLSPVACNDDSGTLQSSVAFAATAGTTYSIQVSGWGGDTGDLVLNVETYVPPSNDARVDATEIPGLPYTANQTTMGASTDPGEPLPCGAMGSTVWYSYTAVLPGLVTANTFGSTYDTVLAAYVDVGGDLVDVACNDDSGSLQSSIQFVALPGNTYYLQVGGFAGDAGDMVLSVDSLP